MSNVCYVFILVKPDKPKEGFIADIVNANTKSDKEMTKFSFKRKNNHSG